MQEKPFYDSQNIDLIGYNSNIADDEEQDEEEEEYVFSLCWSVTVWITFEDTVCVFFCFCHW